MTLEYVMVAALTANPSKNVYWAVLNSPDFDGAFSGYGAGELILPAVIDYSLNTTIIGTGNTFIQGLAGGDLSGVYPNPIVVGLQGRGVSSAIPANGAPLVWSASLNKWIPGTTVNGTNSAASQTTVVPGQVLPSSNIIVGSTAGFPPSGTVLIMTTNGLQLVTYTGTTPTSFTGAVGGTGTVISGSVAVAGGITTTVVINLPDTILTLPQSTINVASTAGYPSSGTLLIQTDNGLQVVTYTGLTPTSFTGVSGGSGNIINGDPIISGGVTTTIGSASNGFTLPQSTIFAGSTSAFPSEGSVLIQTSCGVQTITYTGLTPTSFLGCTGGTCILTGGEFILSGGGINGGNGVGTGGGGGGGGGSGSLLPPVSGQQFAALIENPGGVPVFQRLTQDMILPSFTVSLSGGTFLQVSQSVTHPVFTATYSQAPVSVILSDSDGHTQNVSLTPNAFSSVNIYTKNSFGASTTFTISANNGIVTKTASTTYEWVQFSYFGTGVAGGNSAAFIQALSNHFLTASRGTTFSVTAGAGQHIYFACRNAYGAPTFLVGGFAGGFSLVPPGSISVTNAFGFTDTYQLWVSDNAGLGFTTVTVQ